MTCDESRWVCYHTAKSSNERESSYRTPLVVVPFCSFGKLNQEVNRCKLLNQKKIDAKVDDYCMDACINRYHHVNNANRRKRKVMNQSCFHGFARVLEEVRTYVPTEEMNVTATMKNVSMCNPPMRY